jgi:hypothetical protein
LLLIIDAIKRSADKPADNHANFGLVFEGSRPKGTLARDKRQGFRSVKQQNKCSHRNAQITACELMPWSFCRKFRSSTTSDCHRQLQQITTEICEIAMIGGQD